MRNSSLFITGGAFCGLGVMLGAFAAHGLRAMLAPYLLDVFQTGVMYQFIHGMAILLCAVVINLPSVDDKAKKNFFRAAICFIIGTLCFSGSLYALALTGIKWFGPITPFGGLLFIIGWLIFILAATRSNTEQRG